MKYLFAYLILIFISCSTKDNVGITTSEHDDTKINTNNIIVNSFDDQNNTRWSTSYHVFFNKVHTNGYIIIDNIQYEHFDEGFKPGSPASDVAYISNIHNYIIPNMSKHKSYMFKTAEAIIMASLENKYATIVLWKDVIKAEQRQIGRKYGISLPFKYIFTKE